LLSIYDDGPLVLIGFSYGADNVIAMARQLQQSGVNVPLLITIDPVTPDRVPTNVGVSCNFYKSNGVLDVFPFFRGVPLRAEQEQTVSLTNTDLHDRPDLDSPGLGHRTIAASPKVHAAIIAEVLRRCPPRTGVGP